MKRKTRQTGAALVEVCVWMLAIVPLLLAVPWLARYHDIQRATGISARNAGFDCAIRVQSCGPDRTGVTAAEQATVAQRLGSGHGVPVSSGPPQGPWRPDPLWNDRAGRAALASAQDVTVQRHWEHSTALRNNRILGAALALDYSGWIVNPGIFGLDTTAGLMTTTVTAHVSRGQTREHWDTRLQGLDMSLTGRFAVLADPWHASGATAAAGPRSTYRRVEQGLHLPGMQTVDSLVRYAGYSPIRVAIMLMGLVDSSARHFEFQPIGPELIPADRQWQARHAAGRPVVAAP